MTIPGYVTYTRNRHGRLSGGIATSIKTEDAPNCIRIDEGREDNEFLVTRHSQFVIPINVINWYGQQECRLSKETIENHWNEILDVLGKIEAKNERVVLIGDFNRHLPKIPEDNVKGSYGGEQVKELLNTCNYSLINTSEKEIGGPWTREDPANKENKSMLDLVIISAELENMSNQ